MYVTIGDQPPAVFGQTALSKTLLINNIINAVSVPMCFYVYRHEIEVILTELNCYPWPKTYKYRLKYYGHIFSSVISWMIIFSHMLLCLWSIRTTIFILFVISEVKFLVCIRLILAYLKIPELAIEEINNALKEKVDLEKIKIIRLFDMKNKDNFKKLDHVLGVAILSIIWSIFTDILYLEILFSGEGFQAFSRASNVVRIINFILDPVLLINGFNKISQMVSISMPLLQSHS